MNRLNESKKKLEGVHKKFDRAFEELKAEKLQQPSSPSAVEFKSTTEKQGSVSFTKHRSPQKQSNYLLVEDGEYSVSDKDYLMNSEKQLKKLRRIIETEQTQDREMNKKLKENISKLKDENHENEKRIEALQTQIKNKDTALRHYEDRFEEFERKAKINEELLEASKSKEEILLKNEEELREIIADLRIKLDRKKDRVRDLG